MTTTTAGTQLRAAANLIREHGLSKGALSGRNGSICAMRALGMVSEDVADMNRLRTRMLRTVGLPKKSFLSEWNDALERTPEYVHPDDYTESAAHLARDAVAADIAAGAR